MVSKNQVAAIVLCLVVCLSTMPVQSFAAEMESPYNNIILQMEYINDADCHFSVKDGTATVNAYVRGHTTTTTKSKIVVELQVKSGLSWKNVITWSDTQNDRRANIHESQAVTIGKSYRTLTTVTVWSGSDSESKTLTSKTIKA